MSGTNSGTVGYPGRVEQDLAHHDRLTDGAEPQFQPVGAATPGQGTTAITHQDLPGVGRPTVFAYGLSLSEHPLWQFGRPERMINVRSRAVAREQSIGYLAYGLQRRCPLSYGDTPVGLACCSPIHRVEKDFVVQHGVEHFWELDGDHLEVPRACDMRFREGHPTWSLA